MDLTQLYYMVTSLLFLGTILFAAVAGRAPERWGAGIVFATLSLTWLLGSKVAVVNLVIDTAFALALAALFIAYRRLWVGCALCAHCLLLAFSSTRLIEFPLSDFEYVLMLNLSSIGVFGSLLFGAIASRWGRPADADAEAWGYSPRASS